MALRTYTFRSEPNAQQYYLSLEITENSINKTNNTSSVSYTLRMHSGGWNFYALSVGWTIKLAGDIVSSKTTGAPQRTLDKNSSIEIYSGTATVTHNDDGSLSMSVEASINMPPDTYSANPVSGSMVMNNTKDPTSVTRTKTYQGFYSAKQKYTGNATTSGYWFITTDTPTSSSAVWNKCTESTSESKSCAFTIPNDTSTTSLYKTYRVSCAPKLSNSTFIGARQNYTTIYVPRFAFKAYANSSTALEINSRTHSTLTSPATITNYEFLGYSKTETSTTISYGVGANWSIAINNTTLYAVYRRQQWSQNMFKCYINDGTSAYQTIQAIFSTKTLYGKGRSTGGLKTGISSEYIPTRSGYKFLGWSTSSTAKTATYLTLNSISVTDSTSIMTLYAVWEHTGLVYIDDGSGFNAYQIFIDNGSSWDQCIPYIDNGSSWDIYS